MRSNQQNYKMMILKWYLRPVCAGSAASQGLSGCLATRSAPSKSQQHMSHMHLTIGITRSRTVPAIKTPYRYTILSWRRSQIAFLSLVSLNCVRRCAWATAARNQLAHLFLDQLSTNAALILPITIFQNYILLFITFDPTKSSFLV